jgi:1,4-alpha-glucan branching enzyme
MLTRHTHSSTASRPIASTSDAKAARPIAEPVDFTLNLPYAGGVALVGTFNNWDLKRTLMRKDAGGVWKATLWLPKGRFEYRFIADGQWISDPNAKESVKNPFGSLNSVMVV